MDIFNNILWWVNIVVIIIVASTFIFQLIFMAFFWLKGKKYPETDNYHKFTFAIRACNEEDVIADSVDSCLKVDYPKDKLQVVVFAHNCKDRTAEIARAHGARVVEINDPDPTHRKPSYCIKGGLDKLKLDPQGTHEYILFLDADMQVHKDYVKECNKAADSGVVLGRTFENSRNLSNNMISCMSGLWYIRDNFFACRARNAMGLGCVMNGGCSMLKAEYGFNWDAMSSSDDIEFTIKRMYKDKQKVDYIDNAIAYEDQPETIKDVFNRNTRMGNGLNKLFWTDGMKLLQCFFLNLFNPKMKFSFKMAMLDQYLNLASIPIAFLAVAWFPVYYIYTLIWVGLTGPLVIYGLGSFTLLWFILFIVIVVAAAFFVPFFLQPLISYLCVKKRLVIKNQSVVTRSIIFFPCFMLISAWAVIQGILTNSKWKKVKRSKTKIEQ